MGQFGASSSKSSKDVTECVYCAAKIVYDNVLFFNGETGEPVCNDCNEEEVLTADD